MVLNIENLFGASKTSPCVRQVYGISGSGKTYMLNKALKIARKSSTFGKHHRFIIFDVKHDGYQDVLINSKKTKEYPVNDLDGTIKSINKNRVTLIYPEIEEAPILLEDIIKYVFDCAKRIENFSCTFLLEESSTFIGSHPFSISPQIKRFATQGRSLGLSLLLVNQRSVNNKWVDTQSQSITVFRLAIPDSELLKKRWGLIHEEIDAKLSEKKFSFAHYDLEKLTLNYYLPIKNSKTPIQPQK
tara:strand:+ start:6631 stop:7362 length:732 start_codon:yes stop_codon:yes gene_type:complete